MLTAPSDPAAPPTEDLHPVATVELTLGGMHCNACATRIERALANQPAVLSASVNLATNRAFVTYDRADATPEDLCATVGNVGYSATAADVGETPRSHGDPEHWGVRAAISWPTALLALGVSLLAPQNALSGWTVLVLAIVVELAGGWPFLRTSVRLLRHGATSMDTLITVGTLSALAVERGGGDRPRWTACAHRRWRGVRGAPPRRHGPPHHRHPGHGAVHRGAGPRQGRAGHALLDGAPTSDCPGRVNS